MNIKTKYVCGCQCIDAFQLWTLCNRHEQQIISDEQSRCEVKDEQREEQKEDH